MTDPTTATDRRPLRVVVLYSTGHLGSAVMFNELARMPEVEVVGLVRAGALPSTASGWRRTLGKIAKLGPVFTWLLAWQRIVQIIGYGLGRLLRRTPRWLPARAIAERDGIDTLHCRSVNSEATRAWIAGREPDLLVSLCFTQILKEPVIALPRLGVLNVHPGHLPTHRGAMAYFWVLANGERTGGEAGASGGSGAFGGSGAGGATVHWIDAGIDTGAVLERRRFRIGRLTTQQRVLVRASHLGAALLRRVLRRLHAGQTPPTQPVNEADAAYYPMPDGHAFARYFTAHRFFRIRDVLGLLTMGRREA